MDQAFNMYYQARYRAMESTLAVSELVRAHYVAYGSNNVPNLYGVPEDQRERFNELVQRSIAQNSAIHAQNPHIVASSARRFRPFHQADLSSDDWIEELDTSLQEARARDGIVEPPTPPAAPQDKDDAMDGLGTTLNTQELEGASGDGADASNVAGPSSFPGALV